MTIYKGFLRIMTTVDDWSLNPFFFSFKVACPNKESEMMLFNSFHSLIFFSFGLMTNSNLTRLNY